MKTIPTSYRVPPSGVIANATSSRKGRRLLGPTMLAALVAMVASTQTETAQALPRNACSDLRNQIRFASNMGDYFSDLAETYDNLGYADLAKDARSEAEDYHLEAFGDLQEYFEMGCR